jgi:hypothetical protein
MSTRLVRSSLAFLSVISALFGYYFLAILLALFPVAWMLVQIKRRANIRMTSTQRKAALQDSFLAPSRLPMRRASRDL